jgi:competence protein ComGC
MFLSSLDPYKNTLIIFIVVILVIIIGYLVFFAPKTGKKEKEMNKLAKAEKEALKEEPFETEYSVEKDETIPVIGLSAVNEMETNQEENFNEKQDEIEEEQVESETSEVNVTETSETEAVQEVETDDFEIPEELSEKEFEELEKKPVAETEEVKEKEPKEETKELGKYHVLYRKEDNKWYIKREGSDKTLRVLETQAEAIAWATIKALNQDTAIVIHKRDGKIRKQNY